MVEIGSVVWEKKREQTDGRTNKRTNFLKWSVFDLTPLHSLRSFRGVNQHLIVMVLGGGTTADIEILNLNTASPVSPRSTCLIPPIPGLTNLNRHSVFYYEETITVCADLSSSEKGCYRLNGTSWTQFPDHLPIQMGFAGFAHVQKINKFWILGGGHHQDTDQTFYMDPVTLALSPGPDLPIRLKSHCVVTVNASTFIVAGGVSKGVPHQNRSWIMDMDENDQEFRELPSFNHGRFQHGCGLYKFRYIVVFGGLVHKSSEELDLYQRRPNKWIVKDEFQDFMTFMTMVSVDSGDLFWIGGWSAGRRDWVYRYDGSKWIDVPEIRAKEKRSYHISIVLPETFTLNIKNCL